MKKQLRKEKIRQKQKQIIKGKLQASGKNSSETLSINIEVPVYKSMDNIPDEKQGSVIFIEGHGLFLEDGT